MVRSRLLKNGWLATTTGLALVIWALSFAIATMRVDDDSDRQGPRTGDLTYPSDGPRTALRSSVPDEARVVPSHPDFIETEEEESSCSVSQRLAPSLQPSEWPSQAPSDPHPGLRPCRIIATPLRC